MATTTVQIDREAMGVPGIDGFVFTIEQRPSEGLDGGPAAVEDARARDFEMVAALAKYAPFPSEISASIAPTDGGSYIVVPPGVTQANVRGRKTTMQMLVNSNREIARVTRKCRATGWKEALRMFTSELAPFLDHVSYVADVPLVIEKLYCHDPTNGVHVASFKTPYGPTPLPVGNVSVDALLPHYALYREAKNSTSNYYRLLCYHKILEGIYKVSRPQLRQKAREQKIAIDAPRERVPNHSELSDFEGRPVGRPIRQVYDEILTPQFRDAVAHFSLDAGTTLSVSDLDSATRFGQFVLLAEICAREVINSEEQAHLSFLRGGGRP